jgi:hypothetical protein
VQGGLSNGCEDDGVYRVTNEQRRVRLGVRHHLAEGHRADEVVILAGELCGLHATDPVTVYLAARARVSGFEPAHLESALYDDRRAMRMLGMRRTVFVLPVELAGIVHQACTVKIAAANARRLVKLIEANGVAGDGTRWLADVERDVLAVLDERGEALATELSAAVPALGTRVTVSAGKAYGGEITLNNQVLTHLAAQGRIVRGRPRGRWTATQYRWAPIGQWVTEPLDSIDPIDAETELARRWLATFGPAHEADLRWWTGWTATQSRRALVAVHAVEVKLDTGTGWLLPTDLDEPAGSAPWVALLPALDPTAMGWTQRDWYLGAHRAPLFDRSGNVGPTVWTDGRIVGGWAQRPDGQVVTRLLEDVGAETAGAVAEQATATEAWLGTVRFKPKFRVPLERELAG